MSQFDDDDDFDVDAEIARELAALSDEASGSHSTRYTPVAERSAAPQEPDGDNQEEPESLRALRAAFAAREQFAEQLTHTLADIKTLEIPHQQQAEGSADSQGVAEAVAAFTALTSVEDAVDGDSADAADAATQGTHGVQAAVTGQHNINQLSDRVKLQWIPAVATPAEPHMTFSEAKLQDPHPAAADKVSDADQQQQPTTGNSQQARAAAASDQAVAAAATLESPKAASAGDNQQASAGGASQQPKSDRSWWRKVWHGLIGKGDDKQRPQGATAVPEQPSAPAGGSDEAPQAAATSSAASAMLAAKPDHAQQPSAVLQGAGPSAAETVATKIAAERAAAEAAQQRLRAEEAALQKVLQEQAAAAAAREAAMKALRDQLDQQRVAAAKRHMATWRIARAWRAYKHSAARAARHAQVTALQAVIRRATARRAAGQLRQRREILAELQEALQKGQSAAVTSAQQKAAEAGFASDAQQLITSAQSAQAAAAQQLQQAAAAGNHAAFTAATAAAARYAALQADIAACIQRFESRKAVAEQALAVAVRELPLPQVQGAVDVALQLGVNAKQLAAAIESARARDETSVARLNVAVKAAGAAAQRCANIAQASANSTASVGDVAVEPATAVDQQQAFDSQEFDAATAACQKLGMTVEAAAAKHTLQQHMQAAAVALQATAGQSSNGAAVQEVMRMCRSLGGLQQQIEAASSRLQQRQDALKTQLQQKLQQLQPSPAWPTATAAGIADLQTQLQQLLHQAEQLGVQQQELTTAKQQLQASQDAALQELRHAAAVGSLQQLQQAVATAKQWQISEQQVQHCRQELQQRRSAAASNLSATARQCCTAVTPCISQDHLRQLVTALQQLGQYAISSVGPARSGLLSSVVDKSNSLQHLQELLQQFEQQHHDCIKLGLQSNADLAVAAVLSVCQDSVQAGFSVVASLGVNTDDAAAQIAAEPGVSSSSQPESELLPAEESWYCMTAPATAEDSARTAAGTSSKDSRGLAAPIQQQQQQLPGLDVAAGPASLCSPGAVNRCQQPALAPLIAPAAALQQQWAHNLALAATAPNSAAQANSSSSKQAPSAASNHQTKPSLAAPLQQQQQQLQRLQQVLCANAAVSVSQLHELRQLDLSLEQLVGLQGLGQLCPQLQVLAVDMNKLSELAVQGCQHLQHITAKDNLLTQWPDLAQLPQLQSLLLDNNRIKQLLLMNSSNSSSQQQHTNLHTLSLANHQVISLSLAAAGAGGTSSRQLPDSSSSSSAGSSVPCTVCGLSSYLPNLQVLHVPGNQLSALAGLEGCRSLRLLDVSRNKLTSVQGLAGCHLLQQLHASGNQLAVIPAQLHLPLLQQLDLSSNSFTSWPQLPPLLHLQQLNLSDNRITGYIPYLHSMEQLRVLDLGFNQLTDMRRCIAGISAAKALVELQLHDNPWQMGSAATDDGQQQQQQEQQQGAVGFSWYRQYVVSAIPWLQLLDRDLVYPHDAPQQQQQQHDHNAVAHGGLVSSRTDLSIELMRQLRSGSSSRALGGPLQQATAASTGADSSSSSSSGLLVPGGALTTTAARIAAGAWLQSMSVEGVRDLTAEQRQQQCVAQQHKWQQPSAGMPCRHLQQAAASGFTTNSNSRTGPAGLPEVLEQHWCYNTRVNLVWQQQQEAAKTRGASGVQVAGRVDSEAASNALGTHAAARLAQQHLVQLAQQACSLHQEQLIQSQAYKQQQQALLTAAAEILQCSWRAMRVRRQYKQQLLHYQQQQVLTEAAVLLQSCWRARCARVLLDLLQQQHHQQIADHTVARDAAAAKIQAAVRGHRVRSRLKAALAAAAGSRPKAAGVPTAAGAGVRRDGAAGGGVYAPPDDSTDWDEFAGVPDDFVTMPASLLDELRHEQQQQNHSMIPAASNAAAAGSTGSPLLKVLAAASSSSFADAAPAAPGPSITAPSTAAAAATAASEDLQDSPSEYTTDPGSSGSRASAAARYEAKLQKLMEEWGFADRATAEAYYKRIKHNKQGAMKQKLQEQLKDPTVRLQRLQGHLQAAPPVAASSRTTGKGSPAADRSPQRQGLAALRQGSSSRSPSGSGRASSSSTRRDTGEAVDAGAAWALPAGAPQQQHQSHIDDDRMSMHSFTSYGTGTGGGRVVGEHYTAGPPAGRAAQPASSSRQLKSSLSASAAAKQAGTLPGMTAAPAGGSRSRADRCSLSSGGSSRQVQLPLLSAGASHAGLGNTAADGKGRLDQPQGNRHLPRLRHS